MHTKLLYKETKHVTLKDVLLVPNVETNLLPVKKSCNSGSVVIFKKNDCKFTYEGETNLKRDNKNNLYEIVTSDS